MVGSPISSTAADCLPNQHSREPLQTAAHAPSRKKSRPGETRDRYSHVGESRDSEKSALRRVSEQNLNLNCIKYDYISTGHALIRLLCLEKRKMGSGVPQSGSLRSDSHFQGPFLSLPKPPTSTQSEAPPDWNPIRGTPDWNQTEATRIGTQSETPPDWTPAKHVTLLAPLRSCRSSAPASSHSRRPQRTRAH